MQEGPKKSTMTGEMNQQESLVWCLKAAKLREMSTQTIEVLRD